MNHFGRWIAVGTLAAGGLSGTALANHEKDEGHAHRKVSISELPPAVRATFEKEAKGGEKQGEAWAEVPESFKSMKIPEWPLPTDLKRWQETDRAKTRATE